MQPLARIDGLLDLVLVRTAYFGRGDPGEAERKGTDEPDEILAPWNGGHVVSDGLERIERNKKLLILLSGR